MFGQRRESSLVPNYVILILLVAFALGPLVVLAFNSLKTAQELVVNPLGFPNSFRLLNFADAWRQGGFQTTAMNSVFLVVTTVALELLLAGLAAYSLARLNPPGHNAFMLYMLVGSTLPIWLFLVPLFYLWSQLGLRNTLYGLTILYVAFNAPFATFLLRAFMVQIPRDFEDAARVDGANEIGVFTRVVLPLTWPGFLTVGLVVGLGVWNEFQTALIFTSDPDLFPVALSYYKFTSRFGRDWTLTSAAAVMMIAPVLVLFLALQRRFIAGLSQGGLKG